MTARPMPAIGDPVEIIGKKGRVRASGVLRSCENDEQADAIREELDAMLAERQQEDGR